MGRITGSASVDTLVRVGLEKQHGLTPESRMTVVDDFQPGAADELNVIRGQTVYMLYTEQEWMYVLMEDGREGFIPRSFAKPCRSPALRKRVPPTPLSQIRSILPSPVGGTDDEGNDGDESNSPTNSSSQVGGFPDGSMPDDDPQRPATPATSDTPQQGSRQSTASEQEGGTTADLDLPDVLPFEKRDRGKWVAMFSYDVEQENDVKVTAGEVVTLLNCDDKEWCWVRRCGGGEGFVPKAFLCKLPDDLLINNKRTTGLTPVSKREPSKGHQRSRSLMDQPVTGLPPYFKHSPAHRPPPYSSKPVLSMEPCAGSYSVSRAEASSAARHRPHSSMGSSITSSSNAQRSTPSAGQAPPVPQKPYPRPHSSVGHPLSSSLSQSHSSLPQTVAAEPDPPSTSATIQRPHSSMGHPYISAVQSSMPLVESSTHGRTPSHSNQQRPHSSLGHPIASAWTHSQGNLFSATSSDDLPSAFSASDSANHVSRSNPAVPPPVRNQTASRSDQNYPPSHVSSSNHRPPPLPSGSGFHSSTSSHKGSQSSPSYSPSHSSPTNHMSQSPYYSTNHTQPFSPAHSPPAGQNSPTLTTTNRFMSTQSQSFSPAHSPPAGQNSPTLTTTNRFMNTQSRHQSGAPPRLSSSLNQSQDGRRPKLMHQNSAPEMPAQSNQLPQTTSPTLQGRHTLHEPYLPKSDLRSRTPMLGETGRSKSSTQIPTMSQIPADVTELMTLRKFTSRGADDISVSSGEIVYGDLSRQPERDWLWVYSPRLERHGYIPRNNVRLPGSSGDLRSETVARV